MSLDVLKQEFDNVTTVFFNLYDQYEVEHQEGLRKLARIHDNRVARQNPVRLNYLLDFPEATSWLDEVEFHHTLDQLEWMVPMEGHQVTSRFNRVNVGRPGTVAELEAIVANQPTALNRRELRLCMDVFRTNPLSVTGQNFFSTVHPRPLGGTFSNILTPVFGVGLLNAPALQVLFQLVNDVITHFGDISLVQTEVIDDKKLRGRLLVIVHSKEHHTLFRSLLNDDKLPAAELPNGSTVGERQNSVKGSFELWRDPRPTPGQETWIEFVMLTDDLGPKPAVYVVDTDPEPVVLDENRVSNGFYGVGFQKIFAVKPYIPHSTIQARPVETPA